MGLSCVCLCEFRTLNHQRPYGVAQVLRKTWQVCSWHDPPPPHAHTHLRRQAVLWRLRLFHRICGCCCCNCCAGHCVSGCGATRVPSWLELGVSHIRPVQVGCHSSSSSRVAKATYSTASGGLNSSSSSSSSSRSSSSC
jgi:hypothetical protein